MCEPTNKEEWSYIKYPWRHVARRERLKKSTRATSDHQGLLAFNSKGPLTMKSLKAKVHIKLSRYFWIYIFLLKYSCSWPIVCLILCLALLNHDRLEFLENDKETDRIADPTRNLSQYVRVIRVWSTRTWAVPGHRGCEGRATRGRRRRGG
jgi:hypothetical protein